MPSYACANPTCTEYCDRPGGTCPAHVAHKQDRHTVYDRNRRDKTVKAFYDSAKWKLARKTKLTTHPVCERCQAAFANHVHHRKPLRECDAVEALDQDNLEAMCNSCHSTHEAAKRRGDV